VTLLWDDALLLSELRHGGLTRDSNSASPRFITPTAWAVPPPGPQSTTSSAAVAGGVDNHQARLRGGGRDPGPIRLLLVRDFLGVLASTSVGALPPVWHMDHYQFMLRMVSPDPGTNHTHTRTHAHVLGRGSYLAFGRPLASAHGTISTVDWSLRLITRNHLGLPAEEVYPGLFLGELGAVYKRARLIELKIRSILSVECMPPLWPDVRSSLAPAC
jgi:hypothetical protein